MCSTPGRDPLFIGEFAETSRAARCGALTLRSCCGHRPLPPMHSLQTTFLHQKGHPPLSDSIILLKPLGLNTRCTIGPSIPAMDVFNLVREALILELAWRWFPVLEGIESADRDLERLSHECDGVVDLAGVHESEGFLGSFPLRLVNQAETVSSLSGSSLSRLFSCRSLRSSEFSSVVRPSRRCPVSSWACFIPFRMV